MASPFDIKPPDPGAAAAALQQQAAANQARGASLGAPGQQAQQQAVGQLGQLAQGLGPSPAEMQLQQQAAANQRGMMQAASMGRGGNVAANFGQAIAANAGTQQATNAQAAIQRASEQQAAIAGLGQMGGQMVGQELAFNQLGQQGQIAGGQQSIDWNLGDRAADLARDQFKFQKANAIASQVIGGIGAVAGAASMSDPRAKMGIQPTAGTASDAVAEIDPITFQYKPGLGPPGQRYGVDAAQLEGTSLGSLVQPGPDGLRRVDNGGMASTALAASAEQERRLRALEAQLSAEGQAGGGGGMGLEAEAAAQRRADTVMAQRALEAGRLAGEMRRADASRGPDPFAGAPQMMRGGLGPAQLSGAQTVDPFAGEDPDLLAKKTGGGSGQTWIKLSQPGTDGWVADNRRVQSKRITPLVRSA